MENVMTLKITGDHLFYFFVFIAAVFMSAYMNGHFDKNVDVSVEFASLTKSECDCVRDAIQNVIDGMSGYSTVDGAVAALRSYLPTKPRDIRDIVVNELLASTTLELRALTDQLTVFESRLPK